MVRTTTASGWRVETGRPCVHLAHGQRTAPAGRRTGDAVIGHLAPVEPKVEVAGEPMEQAPLGPRHSVGGKVCFAKVVANAPPLCRQLVARVLEELVKGEL